MAGRVGAWLEQDAWTEATTRLSTAGIHPERTYERWGSVPFLFEERRKTMTRVLCLALVAVLLVGAVGCGLYSAPVVPPTGWAYSKIKAPLDADYGNTSLGSKTGVAEMQNILGLISTGDCSIQAAAAQGKLTTIHHADYEYFNVLGVIQKFTVIVYGD